MTSFGKDSDADRQLDELLDLLKTPPAPSDVLRARLAQAFSRGASRQAVGAGNDPSPPQHYRAWAVAALLALAVAGAVAMPPTLPSPSAPAAAGAALRPVEQDVTGLGLIGSGPAEITYRVALVGRSLGDSDANQSSDSYMPLE